MTAKPTPTGRELEILKVLWEDGPSSVRTVFHRLAAAQEQDLAYNTVQTLLRLMEDKGLVDHHVEGRTFIYTAAYSREDKRLPAFSIASSMGRPTSLCRVCCGPRKFRRRNWSVCTP